MIQNINTQRLRVPSVCILCNQYHREQHTICAACITLFTPLGPACRHCAMPLPDDDDAICGACCLKKPDVDRVITAYRFEEPLRTLLHAFKYRDGLYLTSLLTTLMLHAAIDTSTIQCLIPIPMHPKRLRERGFNQAAILAMRLSRILKLPYDVNQCKKIINTTPQAGLSAVMRKKNLKNAFQSHTLPYQHVTLIDDLLTTGNTANEVARTLKRQGVKEVDVWCCARAVPQRLMYG